MSSIRFDAPPKLADQEAYRYLYRVAQDLNLALTSLDAGNFTPEAQKTIAAGGAAAKAAKAETEEVAATLRGLIVKTAKDVRQEMDRIVQDLAGTYVAQSDFGTYVSDTQAQIEALPGSITQTILQTDTITDMEAAVASLQAYTVETEGFIKQGIVGYDGLTPVIGIAIGQKIRTTGAKVDVDGIEYDVIDGGQTLGVYTSRGLSFYQGGTEVAYLKDRQLYITDARILGSMDQGAWRWEQSAGMGLTLRYVGVNS